MKVEIKHGMGNAVLNAVRSAAFVSCSVTRPIGFKVGNSSNVVSISDVVLEDMTTFISNVSSFDFSMEDRSFVVVDAVCEGEMTIGDLLDGSKVSFSGKNDAVLHSVAPAGVSVVFAKQEGNRRASDNAKFLKDSGLSGYVAVNSRHCDLDTFTYKVIGAKDDCDVFDVSIVSKGMREEEVFSRASDKLKEVLDSMV